MTHIFNRLAKFFKFLTSTVVLFSLGGIILIILGQIQFLKFYSQGGFIFQADSPLYPILKLIGGTLLGSGVFTAIIKSSEYSEVFSKVIEGIIGSKEFIAKRTDKKEFWGMVSKLMYEEKFPLISEELQDVIANHYLPTTSDFYLENYEVFVNITDIDTDFWKHQETIKFILRPSNPSSATKYELRTALDLPSLPPGTADKTDYTIDEVSINNQIQNNSFNPNTNDGKTLKNMISLSLQNNVEYSIVIKQTKILDKKSNPDKRYFAKFIINKMKLTLLMPTINGMVVELYSMGTVNEFLMTQDETNNNCRIVSWKNDGLILPFQGYCVVFKK